MCNLPKQWIQPVFATALLASSAFATHANAATQAPNEPGKIVAADKSEVYHAYNCAFARKIKPANRVHFRTPAEAERAGRRLCAHCARLSKKTSKPVRKPKAPRSKDKAGAGDSNSGSGSSGGPPTMTRLVRVKIKKALPGGTLLLDGGEKVRLVGVNWPASGQDGARRATRFILDRIRDGGISLQYETLAGGAARRDSLGRMSAYAAFGKDNRDLGAELLTRGLAWVEAGGGFAKRSLYERHEHDAAWSSEGIWKMLSGKAGARRVVIGSHARHYHDPDCPHVPHLTEAKNVRLDEARGRRHPPCPLYRDAKGRR